jgi:lysophospholipase L1-like esterase
VVTHAEAMALRRTRRLAANLLLALASGIGFVVLLELGARMLGLRTPNYLGPAKFNCLQRSAILDTEFRPSCTGTTFETAIHTNALGLRGPEVRNDDSIRILALGDSCTWGWHVAQGESYPAQLQQQLDGAFGPGRYQVLNAGVPGSTSYHGLVYLRERGMALRPSIVIAAYGFNDMTPDGDVKLQIARTQAAMPMVQVDDGLLQRSTLYRWVRFNVDARSKRRDQPPRVPAQRYRRNFTQMIQLARRHGANFVMRDMIHNARERQYPEALATISQQLSVPLVVYDGPRIDVVHPTAEGNHGLASRILQTLRETRYVPPGSGGPTG